MSGPTVSDLPTLPLEAQHQHDLVTRKFAHTSGSEPMIRNASHSIIFGGITITITMVEDGANPRDDYRPASILGRKCDRSGRN